MAAARMTGSISFMVMERGSDCASHWTWNQWRFHEAPHPHDPAASEEKWRCSSVGLSMRATPFHSEMKATHQERSARKSLLRRTRWWPLEAKGPDSRFIMRLKKERPGFTTLQAWWSRPTRDSSSRLRHTFLSPHSNNVALMRESLSAGRRMDQAIVSSSIPRKVRHDVGPSHFSVARGTPSSWHVRVSVRRLSAHWEEWGAPTTTKSSK